MTSTFSMAFGCWMAAQSAVIPPSLQPNIENLSEKPFPQQIDHQPKAARNSPRETEPLHRCHSHLGISPDDDQLTNIR